MTYPAGPWTPPPPKHPQAMTSLIVGAIGLGSLLVCCGVLLFVSPYARVVGSRAVREIDASEGRLGGRADANAGRIMGIVGTILIPFALVAVVAYVFLSGYDLFWTIEDGDIRWGWTD
ncbi:hypothetical protein [Aeromicrobium sp. Leaf350]|uniref:hypothetical protein n=1 Tax=Aeromicrobium sp. Leaf350 TaxID=2876565 RepID=UPI001E314BE7|nr:hypothetical protein [Aeromicrobium sp. Leaf350]